MLSKSLNPVLNPTKGESDLEVFSILSQTGCIKSAANLGPCFLSKESRNLTNLFSAELNAVSLSNESVSLASLLISVAVEISFLKLEVCLIISA